MISWYWLSSGPLSPCSAIKNRIERWESSHPSVHSVYVPIEKYPELAAQNGILSAPSVVLYWNGKELLKKNGYFSMELVFDQIDKVTEAMK